MTKKTKFLRTLGLFVFVWSSVNATIWITWDLATTILSPTAYGIVTTVLGGIYGWKMGRWFLPWCWGEEPFPIKLTTNHSDNEKPKQWTEDDL